MITVTTINDIIRLSYLLTSAFPLQHIPSADQLSLGLSLLNLSIRSDPYGKEIPYFRTISFSLETNKGSYIVGPKPPVDFQCNRIALISTAFVTFNKVRYSLTPLSNNEYWRLSSPEIVSAIPKNYFFQPLNDGTENGELFLYPKPNQVYEFSAQVKTDLDELTLYTPITQVPQYYEKYLVYLLASMLVDFFPSAVWNDKKQKEFERQRTKISAAANKNWTIITTTARLRRNNGVQTIYTGGA